MGAPQASPRDVDELNPYGFCRADAALKEAELIEDGLRLGRIGGRIVAEVMRCVLPLDRKQLSP